MKNFSIAIEKMDNYNVVNFITINNVIYKSNLLSNAELELLTIMTYEDYECTTEYFNNIAQIIGYDNTLEAIQSLMEKGARIATTEIYRQLVMNSFKNKHKGLMR